MNFDLQPHLVGDLVELRPLRPGDWPKLFHIASDPLLWEQHPDPERYREDVFREFFQEAMNSGGALTILDLKTGEIIGSSRFFAYDAGRKEVEIGWTFLARPYWGRHNNREVKSLMLGHAFKFVERVFFLVGPQNLRSRKALENVGATLTNNRKTVSLHGQPVDLLEYEIRKSEPIA